MNEGTLRVNADLLEFDDYVVYYEGKPFSGVAVEKRPNGELWSEVTYRFGVEDGPAKEWFENGKLRSVSNAKLGVTDGLSQEWFDNGVLKCEKQIELGYCTRSREWDESGNLIKEFKLTPGNSNYALLTSARSQEPKRVQKIIERLGAA